MAKKPGSTIYKELAALKTQDERDRLALDYVRAGNVPSWAFNWRPIRSTLDGHVLEYYAMPDYLALGDDEDYFHVPLTAMAAQTVADENNAILPSTRMSDEAYANASAKLLPQPIAGNDANLGDWAKHEAMVQKQMKTMGVPGGTFVAGHKKDIVIGPKLDGSKVAIYGWHDESGTYTKGVRYAPIQPYSTIHGNYYTDYAHGTRLFRRDALLDGDSVDLYDIFQDPSLHALVAAEPLTYNPRYPFKNPVGSLGGGGIQQTSIDRGLFSDAPPGTSPKLASDAVSSFKSGDNTIAVQTALVALGYDLGTTGPDHNGVDGDPGPKTTAALMAFQKAEKLTATGKADAATLAKLQVRASEIAAYGAASKTKIVFGVLGTLAAAVFGGFLLFGRKKDAVPPTRPSPSKKDAPPETMPMTRASTSGARGTLVSGDRPRTLISGAHPNMGEEHMASPPSTVRDTVMWTPPAAAR